MAARDWSQAEAAHQPGTVPVVGLAHRPGHQETDQERSQRGHEDRQPAALAAVQAEGSEGCRVAAVCPAACYVVTGHFLTRHWIDLSPFRRP